MRVNILFILILFSTTTNAQNRINKLSINSFANFYSFGEGNGSLNNVVRYDIPFSIAYKTIDTAKKKGMAYEIMANSVTAYYKNILPSDNILEVNDYFINVNLILPVLLFYNKQDMQHFVGVGLSVGTLLGRDYYGENNTPINYNSTNLKELKFGKYWTSSLLLDYQFDFKLSKKIGFSLGARYSASTPVNSKKVDYKIYQGSSFAFKYGVFYQFK